VNIKRLITASIYTLALLAAYCNAQSSSNLPACVGNNPREWNYCKGTFTYPNGNKYTGEYRNGKREGNGIIDVVAKGDPDNARIASNIHSTYTGQFSNDRINGYGVWAADNGYRYEGFFIDNLPSNVPPNQKSNAPPPPAENQTMDGVRSFLQGLNRGFERAIDMSRTGPTSTIVIQDKRTGQ
jgi:hypothetical protein